MKFEEVLPAYKSGQKIWRASRPKLVYWFVRNQHWCQDAYCDSYQIGMFSVEDIMATDWKKEN